MRLQFTLAAMTAIATLGCKSAPEVPAAATPPALSAPVHLFNGKDTSGWDQVLDSKWVVENGVLLERQDPKGLCVFNDTATTEKDFTDFLLAVKFRVTA